MNRLAVVVALLASGCATSATRIGTALVSGLLWALTRGGRD